MVDPLMWRSVMARGAELAAYRRHVVAQEKCDQPYRPGMPPCAACALGHMVRGWAEYAAVYETLTHEEINGPVDEFNPIQGAWREIGACLLDMLKGVTGGLDAVSLHYAIQQMLYGTA